VVASYNRDPWNLFVLGRAKNSEMEMGAYRFFECVEPKLVSGGSSMSLTMKRKANQKSNFLFGVLFALISLIVFKPSSVSADANAFGYVEAKALKTIQWKWSDGVAGGSRTLSKSKFKSASNLPLIVLTIKPISIPRIASLQYENDGEWIEENRGQTVGGQLQLPVSPMCDGDVWCNGSYSYRLVIEPSGDQPKYKNFNFKIKFDSSSSGSSGSSSGGSSGGSSSGSSGGTSAAAFVGWNLEDVQDYLGFDPRTYDCSGSSRSVFWASNWWVVSYSGSTLIVSKSRGYCS
jgi:hypothetical protein